MDESTTDRNRFLEIRDIFERALEQSVETRPLFVKNACGADEDLLRDVQQLLKAHEKTQAFFEQAFFEHTGPVAVAGDQPARHIGSYEVEAEIGRGGMGVVYRARRADGAFDKEVALKLLRIDTASAEAMQSFHRERQILASLEHPNIARILDGGETPEKVPYLVMEFIEGERIDAYVERNRLGINDRLRLFREVCAAVQYAHQNLVVHRDLKPGNILVTADGTVKLLDFGIAKVLSEAPANAKEDARTSERTLTMAAVMTPEFASPEQIGGRPTTTASDVYSLGVILYRLLTGHGPYGDTTSWPELMYAVCVKEPSKPSSVAGAAQLRGELDNIVMMALRKEVSRRYQSVEQFREDIDRYLDGRPVRAQGDSAVYRTRKFVQRHALGVVAVAALILSLAGGIWATAVQARRARVQQALAERRFQEMRSVASTLVFDLHNELRDLPGSNKARKLILSKAQDYLEALARDSDNNPDLQRDLASAYIKTGDVMGNMGDANLSGSLSSQANYQKALAIRQKLAAAAPNDMEAREDLVRAWIKVGEGQSSSGDHRSADASFRKALEIIATVPPAFQPQYQWRYWTGMAHLQLCGDLPTTGDNNGAITACQAAIRELEPLTAGKAPDDPKRIDVETLLAGATSALGNVYRVSGRPAEAIPLMRKAIAIYRSLAARQPQNARYLRTLASEPIYLGNALAAVQDNAAAVAAYDEAIAALQLERKVDNSGQALTYLGYAFSQKAELLDKLGRRDEGEKMAASAIEALRELAGRPGAGAFELNSYAHELVRTPFERLRNPREALKLSLRSVEMTKGRNPFDLNTLAWAYYRTGQAAKAIETNQRALALLPPASSGNLRQDLTEDQQVFTGGR